MNPTKPIFMFHYEPDLVILEPQIDLGDLTYHQYERDLRHVLHALVVDQARNVVIDLNRTSFFGSSVLGFFVSVWKIARRRSGTMAMCGVSPFGLEILRIASFDKMWPICESRSEAIAAVQKPNAAPDSCSSCCEAVPKP
jgi:anti-anti-sigma factor